MFCTKIDRNDNSIGYEFIYNMAKLNIDIELIFEVIINSMKYPTVMDASRSLDDNDKFSIIHPVLLEFFDYRRKKEEKKDAEFNH